MTCRKVQIQKLSNIGKNGIKKIKIFKKEKHRARRNDAEYKINFLLTLAFGLLDPYPGKIINGDQKEQY